MGSSAQIGSGVCRAGCKHRSQRVPESSGGFQEVLEGSARLRKVPVQGQVQVAGAGSGLEGSGSGGGSGALPCT